MFSALKELKNYTAENIKNNIILIEEEARLTYLIQTVNKYQDENNLSKISGDSLSYTSGNMIETALLLDFKNNKELKKLFKSLSVFYKVDNSRRLAIDYIDYLAHEQNFHKDNKEFKKKII